MKMAWLEVLTILLFPSPGKKQIESLDHFAFSRARKKQIGSLSKLEQTGLTEPSLVHGGLGPTKNTAK